MMSQWKINAIKKDYPQGTRVELGSMAGEQQMPLGLQGTVEIVDDIGQIHVKWESGHFEYDSELESYIDFEKYGQDRLKHEQGCFTSYGYICRTDSMEEVCELYEQQEENTQRMGGM